MRKINHSRQLATGLLAVILCFNPLADSAKANIGSTPLFGQVFESFIRTELYFGMNKPNGESVSEEQWRTFLADEVTPRFPDGFTVLDGFGQFRDSNGRLVRENSRLLILLYPKKTRRVNDSKIEEIRTAYKKSFQQESVLRVDFRQSVKVSF